MSTRSSNVPARLAVAALVVASALVGCSSGGGGSTAGDTGASPAAPATVSDLTSKSHGEQGLIIYGNTPTSVMQPLLDAFHKQYAWIKPQYSQLSDNQVHSKYTSEQAQGARTADLLISDSITRVLQAQKDGQFANVTPQGLDKFPASTRQGHGVYVFSPDPVLVTWNAKLLTGAKAPTSYQQLAANAKADPAHYPLVSYSPSNPLGYQAVYGLTHLLGKDKTYAYLDALGPRTKTFDEGLDGLQHMVQGGASAGWLSSGLSQSIIPQYKGLLKYGYMQDATPLVPRLIGQTAAAASPASAQLFLDFVYSAPGQQVMCATGLEAAMNDFKAANGCTANLTDLAKRVPAGSTYLVPVSQDVVDQQQTIAARWNKALGH
ncbi:extracellular solute-binding protein [Streptomyces sp. NPDC005917]|uniref:ABC transporter substrate-binding protein n=1 Tax=unclassified Streptomyces TaxID=2593676 RepID=UPI0033E6E6B6